MIRPALAHPWAVVALLAFASTSMPPAVSAQEGPRRTVLAINWGPEVFPSAPLVHASIQKGLRSDPNLQIDYFVEHLESDVFPAREVSRALADYIRQKYRGRRIDVVIAIADPALQFVLDYRDELFPDVPIVYSGVALPAGSTGRAPAGLTAVLRGIAYAETLKQALALHPSTEQVFVIGRRPDAQVVAAVKAEFLGLSQRMRITFLDQATVPRLLDAVRGVPQRSLILYIFFSDVRPARYEDEEIARMVVSSAPVPVYGTNERYLGTGVVGGVLRGRSETGVRVGELALEILHGARAEDIPIENARLVPTFDWRQLQRWDLSESRLPPGSDIWFRTPTTWELYRGYIIATIAVVAGQSLLIAGLFAQRARGRRAEKTIKAREEALRSSYERSRLLAGQLIDAEEATRTAIARDLHDGVCQDLVGVSMAVASLKLSSGQIQDAHTQRALSMLHDETRDVCVTLRRLSHDLHPPALQLVGLASALEGHCAEVEKREGVQVRFKTNGDCGDIRNDVVVCLFRIAQESVRNAVVHGHAKRLAVSLERSGECIELAVADDGRGFDVEAERRASSGLGLVSMEERARGVGAKVEIISGIRQGTTVRVRGPALTSTARAFVTAASEQSNQPRGRHGADAQGAQVAPASLPCGTDG